VNWIYKGSEIFETMHIAILSSATRSVLKKLCADLVINLYPEPRLKS
jgi:hypothetical protein